MSRRELAGIVGQRNDLPVVEKGSSLVIVEEGGDYVKVKMIYCILNYNK